MDIYCVKCRDRTGTVETTRVDVQVGKDKAKTRQREIGACVQCGKNKSRFAGKIKCEEPPLPPVMEDAIVEEVKQKKTRKPRTKKVVDEIKPDIE